MITVGDVTLFQIIKELLSSVPMLLRPGKSIFEYSAKVKATVETKYADICKLEASADSNALEAGNKTRQHGIAD